MITEHHFEVFFINEMFASKVLDRLLFLLILIDISSSDRAYFEDLVQSPYFVDKTLMIKAFFENLQNVNHTLITCPRKFGKTANLQMLRFFSQLEVDENKTAMEPNRTNAHRVFKNLLIGRHEDIVKRHLAQHPVLYLDLGNVLINATTPEMIFANLRSQIRICCSEYLYVYEYMKKLNETRKLRRYGGCKLLYYMHRLIYGVPTRGEMRKCLLRMAHILYLYFKRKVIVLVDDLSGSITDTLLFRVFLEREMFRFMVPGMMKDFYRFNSSYVVQGAMVTGHSSLGIPPYFYTFAKFRHYHFLEKHPYLEYYGFVGRQTRVLFDKHKLPKQNRTRFKYYYQGYLDRNSSLIVYNPQWVISYLQTNRVILKTPELVEYDDNGAPENVYLYGFMHNGEFRQKIIQMIEHQSAISFQKQYDPSVRDHFVLYTVCKRVMDNFPIAAMFSYIFERGYLSHTAEKDVFSVVNVMAKRSLLQALFLYYSRNFVLFDTMKEAMDYLLRDSKKSTPNGLRQLKFGFDQILKKMPKQKYRSVEDEFKLSLLASAIPRGNLMNDCDIRLRTNYNRTSDHRPNIVVVNGEESFAFIAIVRFNSTLPVSQIIQLAEDYGFYDDRNIKIRKIIVIRVDAKGETMVDERIDNMIP